MSQGLKDEGWGEADEVSDRVIEMLNERVEVVSGVEQLLAGLLLGMLGFLKTCPKGERPESLTMLEEAAHQVLMELLRAGPTGREGEHQA
jgi:hypothetical protein